MIFDPVIPWGWLAVLAAGTLCLFGWLLVCATAGFRIRKRAGMAALYLAGIGGMLFLLANPVQKTVLTHSVHPVWIVAVDASASMNSPLTAAGQGGSRMATAVKDLSTIAGLVPDGVDVRWVSLDRTFRQQQDAAALMKRAADGDSSALAASLASLINSERAEGCTPAGVILLSDGRDTEPGESGALPALARLAAEQGIPVHTLCYGEQWEEPRLRLEPLKSVIHAFPGSAVQAGVRIGGRKLGRVQTAVSLVDSAGKTLEKKVVSLNGDGDTVVPFTFTCPQAVSTFTFRCAAVPGDEAGKDGREAAFTVQAMQRPIRVYLEEGSPYWDSKFLAQLLRRQPAFDVRSIHMLTPNRFYRINTGEEPSVEEGADMLPSSLQDFLNFDIVVMGKGAERMVTPERAAALQSFVRDFGGMLVFARGKAYPDRLPGLSSLEPFIWKERLEGEYQITPSPEGVKDGLFGAVLPSPSSEIWSSLPPLEDAFDVEKVQEGARILARSPDGRIPLIAVRKAGLGAVGLINGDGLWKWDFFPEARRLGNWYEDFWGQFLPWMQTAAEFLPGHDLSLHLERASAEPGASVPFFMSWRGGKAGQPSSLTVELVDMKQPGTVLSAASAVQESSRGGLPRWKGVMTAPSPGRYMLRARVPGSRAAAMPSAFLDVPLPPGERDNLDAAPAWLASLSEKTGGKRLDRSSLPAVIPSMMAPPPDLEGNEEISLPRWSVWYALLALVLPFACFWWIRRRNGLL